MRSAAVLRTSALRPAYLDTCRPSIVVQTSDLYSRRIVATRAVRQPPPVRGGWTDPWLALPTSLPHRHRHRHIGTARKQHAGGGKGSSTNDSISKFASGRARHALRRRETAGRPRRLGFIIRHGGLQTLPSFSSAFSSLSFNGLLLALVRRLPPRSLSTASSLSFDGLLALFRRPPPRSRLTALTMAVFHPSHLSRPPLSIPHLQGPISMHVICRVFGDLSHPTASALSASATSPWLVDASPARLPLTYTFKDRYTRASHRRGAYASLDPLLSILFNAQFVSFRGLHRARSSD
ncbi:hypothetical protein RJ55_07668 [Drechmeria coniospora]|nr:hypothetical protein RJ55_07668 [Drechmeria coniospora]